MLHSRRFSLDTGWRHSPSLPCFLLPDSSEIRTRNLKTPATITEGKEMVLTTLVLKRQEGNLAQPGKPLMFEQANVEMCATSQAGKSPQT